MKTDTQGEHHVMLKAEIGVMQLQGQERQRLPADYQRLGGGRRGSFQRERGPDILILDFYP